MPGIQLPQPLLAQVLVQSRAVEAAVVVQALRLQQLWPALLVVPQILIQSVAVVLRAQTPPEPQVLRVPQAPRLPAVLVVVAVALPWSSLLLAVPVGQVAVVAAVAAVAELETVLA